MNIGIALFPILLVVIIIGLVFGLAFNKNLAGRKSFFSGSFVRVLFVGYVVVLLAATCVYFLLPSEAFTDASTLEGIEDGEFPHRDMFDALFEGRIDEIDEKYIYNRQQFEIDQNQLEVDSGKENPIPIVVERKTANDGIIEAIHIVTPRILNDTVATDSAINHRLSFQNGVLQVTKPKPIAFNAIKFDNELTIIQFTGEQKMGLNVSPYELVGEEFIYLKIPKDLNISGEVGMIESN